MKRIAAYALMAFFVALSVVNSAVSQEVKAVLLSEGSYENGKVVQPAHRIKAEIGNVFGFRYRIAGLPEQVIYDFDLRVTHPPVLLDSKVYSVHKKTVQDKTENGIIDDSVIFTFNKDYELIPGVWTLELIYQNKILLARQ